MSTLLMSVAAAAIIAGGGLAFAQGPSSAPAAQHSAPAEKLAPAHEPNGASKNRVPDAGMKSGRADEKMEPRSSKARQAHDDDKGDRKSKGASSETKSPGKTSADMKADIKTKPDMKSDTKRSDKAGGAKAETTGQGAAGASARLTTEQRTTIRTVIKRHNVRPMKNVTFAISIGTAVPRTVHFYPVPVELVHIYPHWRGYDYFLVGDQIIVVNPRTHHIVAVLDA
jgi:hypothetical protein